jgi:hypothetical protein
MAWAAFMDFIEDKLASDNLQAVHGKRPALVKFATTLDLKENVTEHQLIEVANDVKVIRKTEKKALHGLLEEERVRPSNRIQAHPERGTRIVAELLNRVPTIDQRSPKP